MPQKTHFKHLHGNSSYYPFAARVQLRSQQRRAVRLLRLLGSAFLLLALALVLRQTWLRGGQPVRPDDASETPTEENRELLASPVPASAAPVAVHPVIADVEHDVLYNTEQADTEAQSDTQAERVAAPLPGEVDDILPAYRELYDQNPDLIGWLHIEGTLIDYPVLQAKDDNNYYLRRGFDRLYSPGGSLFLDARCDIGTHGNRPTANWLVYGHNMADGSMFGSLSLYADENFWREHPVFTFDTLYSSASWTVAAVLRTRLGEQELPYYAFFDASDRAQWQAWMDAILPLALYDTGVTPRYGDQLLTLSTCGDTSPGTDTRLAVLAVRVAS